jgi:hypothetical protein
VILYPTLVEEAVGLSLRAQGVRLDAAPRIEVSIDGKSIGLEVVQQMPYIIARVLPGRDGTLVRATTVES